MHPKINPEQVAETDLVHLQMIRTNVAAFLQQALSEETTTTHRVLDVAPQDHDGVRPFLPAHVELETLDIDPAANATYTADLCAGALHIPDGRFDVIVCTEVLEHTLNPFAAATEMFRLLRPQGRLLLSCPFNLRIHGPLPDCWRFTEHGLRAVLGNFEIEDLRALETPDRPLMPIHYTVVARRVSAS